VCRARNMSPAIGLAARRGLDAAIAANISADKPKLAICGGLQSLGARSAIRTASQGQGVGRAVAVRDRVSKPQACHQGSHKLGPTIGFLASLSGLGTSMPMKSVKEIHFRLCRRAGAHTGSRSVIAEDWRLAAGTDSWPLYLMACSRARG